jgi:hypothetical protein
MLRLELVVHRSTISEMSESNSKKDSQNLIHFVNFFVSKVADILELNSSYPQSHPTTKSLRKNSTSIFQNLSRRLFYGKAWKTSNQFLLQQ